MTSKDSLAQNIHEKRYFGRDTMPITFKYADMATVKADLLVNPVNTQGVAGKGVALAIKERYTEFLPGCMAHGHARTKPYWTD